MEKLLFLLAYVFLVSCDRPFERIELKLPNDIEIESFGKVDESSVWIVGSIGNSCALYFADHGFKNWNKVVTITETENLRIIGQHNKLLYCSGNNRFMTEEGVRFRIFSIDLESLEMIEIEHPFPYNATAFALDGSGTIRTFHHKNTFGIVVYFKSVDGDWNQRVVLGDEKKDIIDVVGGNEECTLFKTKRFPDLKVEGIFLHDWDLDTITFKYYLEEGISLAHSEMNDREITLVTLNESEGRIEIFDLDNNEVQREDFSLDPNSVFGNIKCFNNECALLTYRRESGFLKDKKYSITYVGSDQIEETVSIRNHQSLEYIDGRLYVLGEDGILVKEID